jgi:hypothetical protein
VTLASYLAGYLAAFAALAALGFASCRVRRVLLPGAAGALARLAEVVLGLSILVVVLEIVGAMGWFSRVVVVVAVPSVALAVGALAPVVARRVGTRDQPPVATGDDGGSPRWMVVVALVLAVVVMAQWVAHAQPALEGGVRDMDSLRYHGPFAARWAQTHSIVPLVRSSPQNQEMFFPGNTELVDGYGILLFGRDILMPLRNLVWLPIAFLAAWCGGRRLGSGPAALAGLAAVCSTPLLASIEPGSAKNDIVAVALLLAAAALVVHALPSRAGAEGRARRGTLVVAGLAAGLAAGTKLTVLGPLAVLGAAAVWAAGRHDRWRVAPWLAGSALVTGVFWYARNLAYTGTPLPWFRLPLGVVTLAGPDMPYNDRFGYSVAHYAGRGAFWTRTGLPGLVSSFGGVGLLLVVGAFAAGLVAVAGRGRRPAERVIGAVVLAGFASYVTTPWGAGGPEGDPHLFDLDLRFLAPTLALGAMAAAARRRLVPFAVGASAVAVIADQVVGRGRWAAPAATTVAASAALAGGAVAAGWAIARRPVDPHPGAARGIRDRALALGGLLTMGLCVGTLGWAVARDYTGDWFAPGTAGPAAAAYPVFRGMRDARVAVGGFADDYPLYGVALSNHVQYIGVDDDHGGFRRAATCREWLAGLRAGRYDYVVVSVSPAAAHRSEPPEKAWTERDPAAHEVLGRGVTTVFRLHGRPHPASCSPRPAGSSIPRTVPAEPQGPAAPGREVW